MTEYHKLVRNKIPDIIRSSGEVPYTRTLDDHEYTILLEKKLDEEVEEYHQDKCVEELADILEVVFALADNIGCSRESLMEAYQRKHDERGGFTARCFLIGKDQEG